MKAMKSSKDYPMNGNVEVDETVFGGQEEGVRGRKTNIKSLLLSVLRKREKE